MPNEALLPVTDRGFQKHRHAAFMLARKDRMFPAKFGKHTFYQGKAAPIALGQCRFARL